MADMAADTVTDRAALLRRPMLLPLRTTTKRCWSRAAMSFPATEPTTRTATMLRMTSRTSIAPMALRRLRAMQADAGQARRAVGAGRAGRAAAEIADRAEEGGAVDGDPADPVARLRAAAETVKLLDCVYQQNR